MSSIPLPALDVRPPQQQTDPIESMGRLLQMRNLMAQQKLIPGQLQEQQNQIQAGQQENQQRQLQLQDQQAMTQAMHEWDGKDLNELPSLILKHGGSANAVFSTKNQVLSYQKNLADMDKTTLENTKTKNDYIAQAIDNVKSVAPEQQPQAFEAAKADLVQKGFLDPQSAQGLQYQGPQQLDMLEKTFMGHSAAIDAAQKQAETRKTELETGPASKLAYDQTLAKIKQFGLKSVTPQELAGAQAYEAGEAKTTSQSDTLGITSTSTSRPAGLAAVSGKPSGSGLGGGSKTAEQGIVDEIGNYKMNPQLLSRMMYKHPEIIGLVSQKYPDFDQTNYEAKQKALVGYTSGPQSKQINATNVALSHAGVAADAIGSLNNTDMKVWNRLANAVGVQVGQTPKTTFQAIIHKLGPELAQAYIAGGGGEAERQGILKDFDPSLSPEQLRSNLSTVVNLLRPNIDTLKQQYTNTVGRGDFEQRFLTPEAQKSLQRFGGQGAGQPQQQHAPGNQANLPEGTTGKGSDGKRYIVKGGVWAPLQ